jgi:hypothetical protein
MSDKLGSGQMRLSTHELTGVSCRVVAISLCLRDIYLNAFD